MQIPQDLIETAALKLKSIQTEAEFFQLRAKFLGKKSFVASSFSKLRDLKSEEKVIAAKELNILKNNLTKLFETALADMEEEARETSRTECTTPDPGDRSRRIQTQRVALRG